MRQELGIGRTGIGDNFAKTRLLLAKRAGYLPENFQMDTGLGGASAQWRAASKNLAADARAEGQANPLLWLRNRAQTRSKGPVPTANGLAYANSRQAATRTASRPPRMGVGGIGGMQQKLLALLQAGMEGTPMPLGPQRSLARRDPTPGPFPGPQVPTRFEEDGSFRAPNGRSFDPDGGGMFRQPAIPFIPTKRRRA